jgi:hypothetical protein
MLGGRQTQLLLGVVLLAGLLLLLSGCTFWVRMTDGRAVPATLSDQEVQMFLVQMEGMSGSLLAVTRQLRDHQLEQTAIELREAYFSLMQQMGSDRRTPVNPVELRAKMKKLELQLAVRLVVPQQAKRYHTFKTLFDQLQRDCNQFFSKIGF